MQCQHAQELFSDYVAGETDRALTVSLDNHLTTCAACRETVEGLRRVWSTLDALPEVETPLYFHENIMHRLDTEIAQAEEATSRKRALWDWRALFRPRSMALAVTSLALVLICADVVQTQRAELGPLHWIMSIFRPVHVPSGTLQVSRAEWMPNALSGGTLVVHLRAAAGDRYSYRLTVPTQPETAQQGSLTSEETTIMVPMTDAPATISVKLVPIKSDETVLEDKEFLVNIPVTTPAPANP